MKRKTTLILTIVFAVIFGVISSAGIEKIADISQGKNESLIVNRVNITVTDTEFKFNSAEKDDTLTCTLTFSIEKTEPEFYGKINSVTLSGTEFTSVIFCAGKTNGTANFPVNTIITSHEGKTSPLEWEITFSFVYDGETEKYNLPLTVDYTTGVNDSLTQRYITEIPVTVEIIK